MKLGGVGVAALKVGTVNASKAYLGSALVWEARGDEPGGPSAYGVTSWASPGSNYTGGLALGWRFTVGANDLQVVSLRQYGGASAGARTYRLMIHRDSTDAVMTQADLAHAGTLEWHEQAVTPITLSAGVAYTISARRTSGIRGVWRGTTGIAVNPAITLNVSGLFGSETDARPADTSAAVPLVADFGFNVL